MNVIGIGVDLVDVGRVQRMLDRHSTFVERVFSPKEIAYCERQGSPAECFAARWAAREACRKALGGVSGMKWRDVEVDRAPSGAPSIALSGNTKSRAAHLEVSEVKVALTHEKKMAAAFCMAVRE